MLKTVYTTTSPRPLDGIAQFLSPPLDPEDMPDIVDSMSPPHTAEYISAQHALVKDTNKLYLIDTSIEDCHLRILRIQAEIRLLERERRVLERRMSIHRARLSPLRALPDEIIQEIFRHCLSDSHYLVPYIRSAPLLLTHVCRRWRVIAQGTSELWSSISLHDRGVWNPEVEVEMIKAWLSRSRARPIRMSITCSPHTNFGYDQTKLSSDIFRLAIAHSPHLRDLSLSVNQRYLVHFIESTALPTLRSIHISLHGSRMLEARTRFIAAPNLRSITFTGEESSMSVIPPTMFPQITHLSFDCNMTLDLALLFQEFPNLRHLSIKLSLARGSLRVRLPPQDSPRIVAPSLQRLEVCLDKDMLDFGAPARLSDLLDQLGPPALEELAIVAALGSPCTRYKWSMARLGDHMAWVGNPSVPSLLSRSRYPHKSLVCRNFVPGENQVDVLGLNDVEVVVVPPE